MWKVFLLVALSVGAQGGLLTPLFPTCSVPELIAAANEAVGKFQQRISDGLEVMPLGFNEACNTPLVTFPGNLTLNAGIVALPTPFLCSQPISSIAYRLSCRIGAADCTYVHNKYSGSCAVVANPVPDTTQEDGQIFACNDENPHGYDFTNLSAQCGQLLGSLLDPVLDLAFKVALRTRLSLDLCPSTNITTSPPSYNSIGCSSDCRNNHQYASGVCVSDAKPTAVFTGETNSGFQCICAPLT